LCRLACIATVFAAAWTSSPRIEAGEDCEDGRLGFRSSDRFFLGTRRPVFVAVGDVDDDADKDLIVACAASSELAIIVQDSSGALLPPRFIELEATSPQAVVVADLDGDGLNDLAVTDELNSELLILLQLPEGGFGSPDRYPCGGEPRRIIAVDIDMDDDGALDLVVTSQADNSFSIYFNEVGTFDERVDFLFPSPLLEIAALDLDGDGANDLAIVVFDESRLEIWINDGAGFFEKPTSVQTASRPVSITALDIDQDDHPDLAVTTDDGIELFVNDGAGNFQADFLLSRGERRDRLVRSGNLDGDGLPDIATDERALSNRGAGIFGPTHPLPTPSPEVDFFFISVADVDADGLDDVITVDAISGVVDVLHSEADVLLADCDESGIPDGCEIRRGDLADLDDDLVPDVCEIDAGREIDCNGNGVPDSFDLVPDFHLERDETLEQYDNPWRITTADFNGDDDLDVATVSLFPGHVAILINRGDGRFDPPVLHAIGFALTMITHGDVDGDGHIDLVVSNGSSQDIAILWNDGAGDFPNRSTVPLPNVPTSVIAIDLNGDDLLDLAVATGGATTAPTNLVSVVRNLGKRRFDDAEIHTVGELPFSIDADDLDEDGHIDLVTANFNSGDISILWGEGDLAFQPEERIAVGREPRQALIADLDGDGDLDIAVLESLFSSLTVLLNTLPEGFAFGGSTPLGEGPSFMTTSDLDQDDDIDLVVAGGASGILDVLFNDGDAVFEVLDPPLRAGSNESSTEDVTSGDIDGDGDVDVLHVSSESASVWIHENDGNANFGVPRSVTIGPTDVVAIATADLNGDGDIDIAVLHRQSENVSLFRNLGEREFSRYGELSVHTEDSGAPTHLACVDVDGDRAPDLVISDEEAGHILIAFNDGDGLFVRTSIWPTGAPVQDVHAADVDGDGAVDLVAAAGDSGVVVLWNDGNAGFANVDTIPIDGDVSASVVGYLDDDGLLDIAACVIHSDGTGRGSVAVLLNDDSRRFQAPVMVAVGDEPTDLAAADVDADGDIDLVSGNHGSSSVTVLDGSPVGDFSSSTEHFTTVRPESLVVADLDGFAGAEIVAISPSRIEIAVLLHRVDHFDHWAEFAFATAAVSAADLDGDGLVDLAQASPFQELFVRWNATQPSIRPDRNRNGIIDDCETFPFHRGDSNGDGALDLSDPVFLLGSLFLGGPLPGCRDAADGNDDERLDITDAVYVLSHLFQGGSPPRPPGGPTQPCGLDPEGDELECQFYGGC
jgi:hypothetical protein